MKKTLITILLASLATGTFAKEYWVKGVSEEKGWVDINKGRASTYEQYGVGWFDNGENGDGFLCWAAAASNVLTWWHQQNPGAAAINPDAPSTKEAIWSLFKKSFKNASGIPEIGVDWYLNGNLPEEQVEPYPRDEAKTFEGYYTDAPQLSGSFSQLNFPTVSFDPRFNEYYEWNPTVDIGDLDIHKAIAAKMAELMQDGYIITLGIAGVNVGKHAVTLWGIELDEDGYLSKMWITDSDDNLNGYGTKEAGRGEDLIELICQRMSENMGSETLDMGTMTSYGFSSPNNVYVDDQFKEQKDGRYWYAYDPEGNMGEVRQDYFYEFTAIKMPLVAYQGVPEPATGTLSLLALAGLAARRRRKG